MRFLKRVDSGILYALTGKRYTVSETGGELAIVASSAGDEAILSQVVTPLLDKSRALSVDEEEAIDGLRSGDRPIVPAPDRKKARTGG